MHPKDWDNPGRVRVELRKNGRLANPAIKSKKQLLEAISFQIQRLKPDNIPKPPYNTLPPHISPTPAPKSAKSKSAPTTATKCRTQGKRRLPIPPTPHPPLANRVSLYSPALVSGVLIETVKAGMNAAEGTGGAAGAGPGVGPGGAGMGKGKRKVVRVRG